MKLNTSPMSTLWQVVKSMRIITVLMAVFMTALSFKIADLPLPWYVLCFVFFAGCAVMVHNDLVDAEHDVARGKGFALTHKRNFRLFSWTLWGLAAVFAGITFRQNLSWGLLSAVLIVLGAFYQFTYTVPGLSALFVAGMAADAVLYSLLEKPTWMGWVLFAGVAVFILGREILKDIIDLPWDVGYKRTLPLLMGINKSSLMATTLYLLAILLAAVLNARALFALPFLWILYASMKEHGDYKLAKILGDVAIIFSMVMIWMRF